ncbi:MAG: HAMP domain-containing histidine kinase, partial [Silvibacterium sp.]|nr:HAMP domain-containing histidine kinase [Silvibacterium sp.]
FFTTKKDVGTGLGLWVSRGLIEKHNGTLTVETKTGGSDHGTTFTITLPAAVAT